MRSSGTATARKASKAVEAPQNGELLAAKTGVSRISRPKSAKRNQAGRPTQQELDRRKVRIMQVATSLFIRNGYAATSLVDIAKAAGVATRTLYQHFGGKEAIFQSVMFARDTAAVFPSPPLRAQDSLFDAMMRMAQYVCDVSLRKSTVDLMRLAIAESLRFPKLTQRLMEASYSRFRATIKEDFDALAAAGMVNDPDTAAAADMFIDLILGTTPMMFYAGWNWPEPRRNHLESKLELFIQGRFGLDTAKRAREPRKI